MRQIEHDPNERHPSKPTVLTVLSIAIPLGLGMVFMRGGFEGFTFAESVLVSVAGLVGVTAYFGLIHIALKGWDRLIARLRGG